ncbi:MAG: hypothetical protein PF487_14705, partial [Bacteroidales bacterium]|nr:hypothetical protein [Bacteroidales bacterium]
MLNKFKNICKIDGIEIVSEYGRAVHKLKLYLKNKYNLSLEDYILEYYFNNEKPKCLCGCGNETKFHKGWYYKFYGNHKNLMKQTDEVKLKIKKTKNDKFDLKYRLNRLGYTVDDLTNLYTEFI